MFDPLSARKTLETLNKKIEAHDFWDDAKKAQAIMRQRTELDNALNLLEEYEAIFEEQKSLLAMAQSEGEKVLEKECYDALTALADKLAKREIETLLDGEADANDGFLEIHAGAGGTESQDWALMLLRMYLRWAATRGYKTQIISQTDGEEAGIKSVVIKIMGSCAYGWAKTESGIHRLVRISPFDSQSRRHTSFASVGCYPVIDEKIEIDIGEQDVRIDTYRASGAGGQHVNTTDSAVRITHKPTKIVVQCQNERSQHKNRATAWAMLRARLYEMELQKREAEVHMKADDKTDIGWGHQIRSYVLQPYQMVKDLRTGLEVSNPQKVLDGGLDDFIEAALIQRVGRKEKAIKGKATKEKAIKKKRQKKK